MCVCVGGGGVVVSLKGPHWASSPILLRRELDVSSIKERLDGGVEKKEDGKL